ncbi:unnamed protein product [marine sediment metagenome]|uniref:Uncharacterized protein n=1 Tax=marine sediment metagenome TaxID=412755 RepID=X1G7V9_9ZZZZ
MADQYILGKMIGEGNLTTSAAEDKATVTALNKSSPSPPIKKQDYLLPVCHCFSCSL